MDKEIFFKGDELRNGAGMMAQKARLVKRAEVVARETNARGEAGQENQQGTTISGTVGSLVQWVKQSQRSAESKGASHARERFDALFARS